MWLLMGVGGVVSVGDYIREYLLLVLGSFGHARLRLFPLWLDRGVALT